MSRIVTFGELMLRLQPYNYERFVQCDHVEFTFGGGEANVAVSLANYGMDAAFVTKLPTHAIGQAAVNSLRRYGVDTSLIVRGGERVGIYYNEKGASQRGSVCIYDRANSAIQKACADEFDWDKIFEGADWFHFTGISPALGPNVVDICRNACKAAKARGIKISCDLNYRGKLWTRDEARQAMTDLCQYVDVCIYDRAHSAIQMAKPEDFDWDKIFEGADWFHFTGITPALGPNVVEICKQACQAAKAKGIKISCDLNYRGKLWTRAQANEAMTELAKYIDVCISNEEDAKDVFGIEAEATDIYGGQINHEGYKSVARQLADKFGFEMVAITLRESRSAFDNGWSAMLYNVAEDKYCFSKKYDLHIIDRVGGGDSFGGGLIYSVLNGKSTQAAVEFAVAASALKHSIEGDYNMVTVAEVEKLAGGDGSGRIQR